MCLFLSLTITISNPQQSLKEKNYKENLIETINCQYGLRQGMEMTVIQEVLSSGTL